MSITANIVNGPLAPPDTWKPASAGAVICFEGIVRAMEDGRELIALDYETYDPMALGELQNLASEILTAHQLLAIDVEHSRGVVPVGQISLRLRVASMHRQEGIAAMDVFIDRLKRDVPIWKLPVFTKAL